MRLLILFAGVFFALWVLGCSDKWGSSPEDPTISSSSAVLVFSSGANSADVEVSSSSALAQSFGAEECPNLEGVHSVTDCRDNQVYSIDTLGGSVWMTENLRYVASQGQSWCYSDSTANCQSKGRLYDWIAAMESCPFGWHLPDTAEWSELAGILGGDSIAGKNMRFPNAFGAKPSGYFFGGVFQAGSDNAYWWTSNDYENDYALYRYVKKGNDSLLESGHFKDNGFAVRCTKEMPSSSSMAMYSSSSFTCGSGYHGVTMGNIIDDRDQQEYATVRICAQEWLAENLNYSANNTIGLCGIPDSCDQGWGRWYTWNDVMGDGWAEMYVVVAMEQAFPGICPSGWHLPDNGDLDALYSFIFQQEEPAAFTKALSENDLGTLYLGAARYLKASVTGLELWDSPANNANDPFHWGVKPAGGVWSASESLAVESEAGIWYLSRLDGSGSQGVVYQATGMRFREDSPLLDHFWGTTEHALSVRCVRTVRD